MPANSLPVGARLHEYEIKSILGEGGFGIVYLAHDTLLDRDVAIKEFLPVSHAVRYEQQQVRARTPEQQTLFDKGMQSFVAEARILAQFRNRNLVEVLRFWEGNGTAYLVMPYYQGSTLRELIQKGYRATSKADLLSILLPLIEGLAQVHAVGCYHRDISPDNILILADGTPLLLDFGAARHEMINQAEYSTVILKPGFAPIEQYGGRETATQQGSWTDVYALCAVAYQMITGIAPAASVARIMRDPVVSLASQSSALPLPFNVLQAIDAGLQIQPQDRPQTMEALQNLLLQEETIMAAMSDNDRVEHQTLASDASLATVESAAAAQDAQLPTHTAQTVTTNEQSKHGSKIGVGLALLLALGVGGWLWLRNADSPPPATPDKSAEIATEPTSVQPSSTVALASTSPAAQPAQEHKLVTPQIVTPQVASSTATENGNKPPEASSAVESPSVTVLSAPTLPSAPAPTTLPAPTSDQTPKQEPKPSESLPQPVETGPKTAVDKAVLTQEAVSAPQAKPIEVEASNSAAEIAKPADAKEDSKPEAKTEDEPPKPGRLIVEARPWGDVYVNGELVGTTPPRVSLSLPAGAVQVEIRNDSAPAHKRSMELRPGQTSRITHDFRQPTGQSAPKDAP